MDLAPAPKFPPLDRRSRLSSSRIWEWQRQYFELQGVKAWSEGLVPHHVSCSPFLADAYARFALGHLRDICANGYDPSQPVYVIELGAGSGRFGYRMLRRLRALMQGARLGGMRVTCVMTDFTPAVLASLQSHPWLRSLLDEGWLDFACFDAERDEALKLTVSGVEIQAGYLRNPLILIANYVFDSLPQDAFQVEGGVLYELLATVRSAQKESAPEDPAILMRAEIEYEAQEAQAAYYDNPVWNAMLERYRRTLPAAAFTFPTGALSCIARFERIADGRLLLLSGDRGYHSDLALAAGQGVPDFARHGSVSMLVDYQLIGNYAQLRGGVSMLPARRCQRFAVCAILFGWSLPSSAETRAAYEDLGTRFTPDDFYALKEGIERTGNQFALDELLAYLRLGGWDHLRLEYALPLLKQQLEHCSDEERSELADILDRTWENYLPIGEQDDLAFKIGVLLLEIGRFGDALRYFGYSAELYGREAGTLYNMALCHAGLGRESEALACVDDALASLPGFDAAKALRLTLIGQQRDIA